jgi:hypothetical protein
LDDTRLTESHKVGGSISNVIFAFVLKMSYRWISKIAYTWSQNEPSFIVE